MQRSEHRSLFEGETHLKITLMRSHASEKPTNKRTLLAMGLRRPGRSVVLPNHETIWGMIFKLGPIVTVSKAEEVKKKK